jgi:hypothetical protein
MGKVFCSLFATLLMVFSALPATWQTDGSRDNIKYTHDFLAVNGDTITLPASPPGTPFNWTTTLTITKAITLQGQGTLNTVVADSVPSAKFFDVTLAANGLTRITGIKFQGGARVTSPPGPAGIARIKGRNDDGSQFRMDHCELLDLNGDIVEDTVSGVFDHNVVNGPNTRFYVMGAQWNGANDLGDASMSAPTNLGSSTACVWEDNVFTRNALAGGSKIVKACVDGEYGARIVFRRNQFYNTNIGFHGLESGVARGVKSCELYQNEFFLVNGWPASPGIAGFRSAVNIGWGNRATGWPSAIRIPLNAYRDSDWFNKWPGADGTNYLDINAPTSFWVGSAAATTTGLTVTVTGPSMTTNQFVGYTLKRTTNIGSRTDPGFAYITANTGNTITYAGGVVHGNLGITSGDSLQVWRVKHTADIPGRTGGSLVSSVPPHWNNQGNVNDQVTEPCYSWDNRRTENLAVTFGFDGGQCHYTVRTNGDNGVANNTSDVHFYNDTVMPGYTPYVYPHPLVSGASPSPTPPPTPSPTPTATATATATPTSTPISSPTPTPEPSPTPTATETPTATPTATATATETPSPTPTSTPIFPIPPTNLGSEAATSSQIDLHWTNNDSSAVSVFVERSAGQGFGLIGIVSPCATRFSDFQLRHGSTYWYRVRIHTATGYSNYSNVTSARTL